MKKLGKLKLSQLSKEEMEKREMNNLRGGDYCVTNCGCEYAGDQCSSGDSFYGGSSTKENRAADGLNMSSY
jgi:natural product precursor